MRLDEIFNIQEGVHDPNIFKCIFVVGGPGSGKSYFAHKLEQITGLRPVDSDMFFELKYKKQVNPDLSTMDKHKDQVEKLRGEVGKHNRKRLQLFQSSRLGFIFDGTGKDFDKTVSIYKSAEELGYDGMNLIVNCDLEEALRRNSSRSRKEDPAFVQETHEHFQKNIPMYKSFFGGKSVILDNTNLEHGKQQFEMFAKRVLKFLKQPIMNPVALDWIEQQKKAA